MSHPEDVPHPIVPVSLLPMYNPEVGCVAGYLRKKPSTKQSSYWNSMKWPRKWVWIPIDIHGSQNYQLFFLESSWTEATKIHRVFHLVGALLERIGDTLFVIRIPNDEDLFFQTESIGEANRWIATLTQLIRAANLRSDSLSKAYMDLVNNSLDTSFEAIRARSESNTWWNSLSGSFASHDEESIPDTEESETRSKQTNLPAGCSNETNAPTTDSIKHVDESLQTLVPNVPEKGDIDAGNIVEEAASCAFEVGGVIDPMMSTINEMLGSVLHETETMEESSTMVEGGPANVPRDNRESCPSSPVAEEASSNDPHAEDDDERHMTETDPLLGEHRHNVGSNSDDATVCQSGEFTIDAVDADVVSLCNHLVFEGAVSGENKIPESAPSSDHKQSPTIQDSESQRIKDPSFIQTVLDDVADGVVGSEDHEDDTEDDELNGDGRRAPLSTPIEASSTKGANEVMDLEDLPFYLPPTMNTNDPEEKHQANDDSRSDSTKSVDGSPTRGQYRLPIEPTVNGTDGSYVIVSPAADGLAAQSCTDTYPSKKEPIGDDFQSIDDCRACDPHTARHYSEDSDDHNESVLQTASIDSTDTGDFVRFIPFIPSLFETKGGQHLLSALGMIVQFIGWTMVRTVWIMLVVCRVLCVVVLHSATALHWRLAIIADLISSLYHKCTNMQMAEKK